jgi:hypothetical protein
MKYKLGTRFFASKQAIKEFCKELLERYSSSKEITGDDDLFLRDLIKRHPDAIKKIGCGIRYFTKDRTVHPRGSCFWIHRLDGSVCDFSYKVAADGRRETLDASFNRACRWIVQPDILNAKEKAFMRYGNDNGFIECELTGQLIDRVEAQADHAPPMVFAAIVVAFKALMFDRLSPDIFKAQPEDSTIVEFADRQVAAKFLRFHHRVAKLRIIAKNENLKIAPLHFTPPIQRPLELELPIDEDEEDPDQNLEQS